MNLDKVYTNSLGLSLIKLALESNLNYSDFNEIVDPCAGSGQFKTIIPITHQYDIEPESREIIQIDFFKLELDTKKRRLIVCSPPFGEHFDIGKRFLIRASKMSNAIGSIVSKNVDLENLIPDFRLVYSEEFKNKCFIKNGDNIEINHYFCIWIKD